MLELSKKVERLPKPDEIVAHLNKTVIGQSAAKRALALSAYRHFLGLSLDTPGASTSFGKQHVLLIGPTGTGKTRLVQEMGSLLDVPMAVVSATSLVEVGYVGEQVDSAVRKLVFAADGDIRRAERGIIFIDEIDKARRSGGVSRDVSGEGVQNALLKLMDGISVTVRQGDRAVMVDTKDVLFVFAGAFSGLEELRRRRTEGPSEIGFSRQAAREHGTSEPGRINPQDLVEFGLIQEFVGRFGTIASLSALTRHDLERILVEPSGSLLSKARRFFGAHGAELRLSRGALEAIADRAAKLGSGARALERVATEVLEPTTWRLFTSERPVSRVDVTRETVTRGARARFHFGKAEGVRAKERPSDSDQSSGAPSGADTILHRPLPYTEAWYERELEALVPHLGLQSAPASAKKWWNRLNTMNKDRLGVVHFLASELRKRQATVTDAFHAQVYAKTDNLQAVLHYLDYLILMEKEREAGKE